LDKHVHRFGSIHEKTGGCDAGIVGQGGIAHHTKHAHGGMGVVGDSGKGDDGVETGLDGSHLVEGMLSDSVIVPEKAARDLNTH
jgi:hypothetical protein